MSDQVLSAFDALCEKIALTVAASPWLGEDKLEPMYEELLAFLEAEPAHRAALAQRLIEVIGRYRHARESKQPSLPAQAIAYSMHVLRWPEVLAFATRENDEFYVDKMSTAMAPIVDAYNDGWDDRDFYRRFAGN